MADHSETITIGTTATPIRPSPPVTDGNALATASFVTDGTISIGGPGVTTADPAPAADTTIAWQPGLSTKFAVAAAPTDIDVFWEGVDLGTIEAPTPVVES
ncbi:MAG: hypothetical protein R3246_08770 [Acidimicrobiia bacterium]|nr:hypothetical protein [Acidimicrobiia bacterium]